MAVKVDRSTRLFANSTKENVQRARILAAREVPYGEKGTTQDLINYLVCALYHRELKDDSEEKSGEDRNGDKDVAREKKLMHKLYWEGKKLFEGLDASDN
jgi:hypothetical protein